LHSNIILQSITETGCELENQIQYPPGICTWKIGKVFKAKGTLILF